ncbi:uncharacterized protein LOC127415601 [Myxocyprinus asiaticus]|uniref:uncharacterized protein LOC127415601 n=1 Tax=Myxocyprinus asiaticus TaxID=70543 RepID=UPI00222225C5|nr:uncharacterized protein LOC127415601 [Myxocyprinus asiaticus]
MNSAGSSSWLVSGLAWMNPNSCRPNNEKFDKLASAFRFLDAGIDDVQVLTLTREDLNELFPGIKNFHLRRKIMALTTDMKSGSYTFASALNNLIQRNNNDAAVQGILRESLWAFRKMEEQLKVAQASLKPSIDVLNSLMEASVKKDCREAALSGKKCKKLVSPQLYVLMWKSFKYDLYSLTANKKAVLVVMHHTFNPNYVGPSSNATSSVNIVEHVHVFFHDTAKGLLMCPTNDHAIIKFQSVLHQYVGTRMS